MKQKKIFAQFYYEPKQEGEKQVAPFILLNAYGIDGVKEYIPTDEMIGTHIAIQKIKLQKDEKYVPEPLVIIMEDEAMDKAKKSVRMKTGKITPDFIPLVGDSSHIPFCILISRSDYEKTLETLKKDTEEKDEQNS